MLNSPHTYVGVVSDFFVAPPLAKPPDNHKPFRSAQGATLLPDPGLVQLVPDVEENGGISAWWKRFILDSHTSFIPPRILDELHVYYR